MSTETITKYTFKINIRNKTNNGLNFALLYDKPRSAWDPKGEIETHVMMSSGMVPPDATVDFDFWELIYAVYDQTTQISDSPIVTASTLKNVPVKLGPDGDVVVVTMKDGKLELDRSAMEGRKTAVPGAITFIVDKTVLPSSPDKKSKFSYGIGRAQHSVSNEGRDIVSEHNNNNLIQLGVDLYAMYPATPGTYSVLTPEFKYYMCFGKYEVNSVVDRATVGPYLQIDFTRCKSGEAYAKFVLNVDGTYTADKETEESGIKWREGPVQ